MPQAAVLQFSDHRIGGRLPAARQEGGAGLAAKIRGPRAPHDQRDQREPQPEAVLQLAGGGQVRRGVVQPGGPRAAAGQARRHIPGAAAQLAAVPALQVSRQHARLRLSDIFQILQAGSAAAQLRKPGPAYSAAHRSHAARLHGT